MGLRAAAVASALVLGIVVADLAAPGGYVSVAAGIAGVVLMGWAWIRHRRHGEPATAQPVPMVGGLTAALLVSGVALVGFCDLGVRAAAAQKAPLARLDGRVVEIAGRMASDPSRSGRAARFFVHVSRADEAVVSGKLAVSLYGPLPALEPGDEVAFTAKLKRLGRQDSYEQYLRRKGTIARASGAASGLRLVAKTRTPLLSAANSLRREISHAARSSLPRPRAGLLLGLLVGDESGIEESTRESFRAAGLSHLTAVSGANVAMVVAPLMLLLTAAGVSRRTRVLIGMLSVTVFVMVTRWEPSVLRAAVMASVALAAFLFGRKADPRHVLGLAFIGLAAADPLILWSVGFQLSFAATAGIVILAPLVFKRMGMDGGGPAEPPLRRRFVWQALVVTAAAQVAVMPLLAWHFGRVSMVAAPANLAAFPLVAPATVLGMSGGLVSVVSEAAGRPLLEASGGFVWALEKVAGLFGGSAHAETSLPDFKTPQMIAAYLALAAVIAWLAGRRKAARWPLVMSAAVIVGAGLIPVAHAGRPAGMRLTFFDVGQGDAALVESRLGARVLIDGGPDPTLVARSLIRRGIDRIDLVIASHAHFDHIAGLGEVVERLEVRKLVDPGVDDPLVRHVFGSRRPIPAEAGEKIVIADLTVDYLAPNAQSRGDLQEVHDLPADKKEGSALNDASVVARVAYGKACAIFPGDLEEAGQQALLDSAGPELRCAILKAPHHGSARLLPEFVEKVDPQIVAVSTGPNDFGHPTTRALTIFSRWGAKVLRTDLSGDIVIEAGGNASVVIR